MLTKRRSSFFLILIILIGPVISEDNLFTARKFFFFDYKDITNGQGSFASRNELINQRQEQLTKTDHGSGDIERDMHIGSAMTAIYDDFNNSYLASFAINVNSNMNYAPRSITIDTSYYVAHPIQFNTRLSDQIHIKNYPSETSMNREIMYATGINSDLTATTSTGHVYTDNTFDFGKNSMSLSEEVTDGITHIGMLHSDAHDMHNDKGVWSIANVDVDEIYSGTFDLKTNMSMYWPVKKTKSEDPWLSCCFGGWNNMSYSDKNDFRADTNGVFDCACSKGITKV